MATKKQKREAALAKRKKFMEEERQRGLEAQRSGHQQDRLTELSPEVLAVFEDMLLSRELREAGWMRW